MQVVEVGGGCEMACGGDYKEFRKTSEISAATEKTQLSSLAL